MTDIFDATILCKKCNLKMRNAIVERNGFELRAVECPKCHDKIIHPADLNSQEHFDGLKDKKFDVKLRVVGNSHAISIPKEIIDFMNHRQKEAHRRMNDVVSLMFDDLDTLKVSFFDDEMEIDNLKDEDYDDGDKKVKRRVRNDGRGNIDIVEEQSLNDQDNRFKSIRIKKIRRFSDDSKR